MTTISGRWGYELSDLTIFLHELQNVEPTAKLVSISESKSGIGIAGFVMFYTVEEKE